MRPEVGFILMILEGVVDAQPADHPLFRIDRDNSRVFETGDGLDMQQPLRTRRADLERANLVGAAWTSRDQTPVDPQYDLKGDIVVSVRVEGLTALSGQHGHIDPDEDHGVSFVALCDDIRSAILGERVFPDHPAFGDTKTDLRVMNEDDRSAQYRDFYQYDFDVVFNFRERP